MWENQVLWFLFFIWPFKIDFKNYFNFRNWHSIHFLECNQMVCILYSFLLCILFPLVPFCFEGLKKIKNWNIAVCFPLNLSQPLGHTHRFLYCWCLSKETPDHLEMRRATRFVCLRLIISLNGSLQGWWVGGVDASVATWRTKKTEELKMIRGKEGSRFILELWRKSEDRMGQWVGCSGR